MVEQFRRREKFWLGIAPEGTRKPVTRWKSGFWHIARAAGVPIVTVWFNYPDKTIGIGPVFETSNDMDADLARLRAFYAPFKGKHRGV
jgi:1-acyl-sn-glycerol-3-phosphate acyltransferase